MSAASILPQAPETAIVQAARTIEERVREWEVKFYTLEDGPKEGARDLYLIYRDWARASFQNGIQLDAFLDHVISLGVQVSRSTLYRRVRVGFSLTRVNPDLAARMTLEQLDDAYDLILAGEGSEGVAQAVEEKSLERKAYQARNKGTVRVPLTEFGVRVRREIIEALRAGGVQVPEPELDTLAWQFCAENARSFASFVEREAAE